MSDINEKGQESLGSGSSRWGTESVSVNFFVEIQHTHTKNELIISVQLNKMFRTEPPV